VSRVCKYAITRSTNRWSYNGCGSICATCELLLLMGHRKTPPATYRRLYPASSPDDEYPASCPVLILQPCVRAPRRPLRCY
jgi:hypothetical protein